MKNNENEKAANSGKKPKYVKKIITETILKYKLLSFGIVAAVTWYGDCIFCNAFFNGAY